MDDIRRKLALIDKQLAGGFVNSYKRIITTGPLLFAAVGLIAGILIQSALMGSRDTGRGAQFVWLILLIASAVSAILLFIIQAKGKLGSYAPIFLSSCAFICFICLGAIQLISFYHPKPNDIRKTVTDEPKLATFRGLIITEPFVNKNQQWQFAKFKFTDPTTSFYLKVMEIKTIDGWAEVTGTIRVQVDERVLGLKAGDYIQAYCWLDRFEPPTNPGQFDIAKYLARRNVYVAASVKSRDAIEVLQSSSADFFVKIKRKAREIAMQSLLGSPYPQDESEGLLQALVLGYRADMDSATYNAFRKTGLLHFLCLSGMNFGIFVGMIWWLCKTAGLTRKNQAAVCIIAAAMFVLVVPSNPPAFRAAIICLVFCLSFFFRRRSNPFNSLSLAAVILLMIKPTELFEVSWQLSFASVLGILLLTDRIHFFLYEKITDNSWFEQRQKTKGFAWVVLMLLNLFCISLAAWLASAGILLYNFYTIQPLTSTWTVVASPFIAVISFLGYLKLLMGLALPTVASILDIIIKPLSSWLIWLVRFIAKLDDSPILIGHVPIAPVILYYGLIFFVAFAYFRRPLLKKVVSSVLLLTLIIFLGVMKWQRTHRDNLIITCLDVGHGQAILAQLPGKANILFDAGSLFVSNIGGRIVCPFLDYSGIDKIDAVVISHGDIDHINGIPEIVEHCKVEANDVFFDKADKNGAAKFLKDQLLEQGHEIQSLGKDLNLGSKARIRILWPSEQMRRSEELDDNDKSQVCLIEFAGKKMLLCSDIEKFAQRELLKLYPDLKVDVVIVPHHGSSRTADPNFLEDLGADILICSCDRGQYERVKPESVPETANPGRAKSLYTAKDGAIIVSVNKDGVIMSRCVNE